jgi:hypothetical protein
MNKVLLTGRAKWKSEAFDFKIGERIGGIGLMMRHTGSDEPKETGAGIWPTIDKAKEIADQTVKRLLDPGCHIVWTDTSK